MWYVGKGIIPGDYFVYHVCDYNNRYFDVKTCYQIRLDFYLQLQSHHKDNIWVVQAEILIDGKDKEDDDAIFHIFLIDSDTMQIKTDQLGSRYANSIKQTIFYLHSFAPESSPKRLDVGEMEEG